MRLFVPPIFSCDMPSLEALMLIPSSNRGFPSDFILPMCMVARKAGVTAHWREAMCKSSSQMQAFVQTLILIPPRLSSATSSLAPSAGIRRKGGCCKKVKIRVDEMTRVLSFFPLCVLISVSARSMNCF